MSARNGVKCLQCAVLLLRRQLEPVMAFSESMERISLVRLLQLIQKFEPRQPNKSRTKATKSRPMVQACIARQPRELLKTQNFIIVAEQRAQLLLNFPAHSTNLWMMVPSPPRVVFLATATSLQSPRISQLCPINALPIASTLII